MVGEGKIKTLTALTGGIVGACNGFFGGGGGMIAVPLMIYLLKVKTKVAHATAILIILPITVVSAIVYFVKGRLDFSLLIPIGLGVTAGGILGAKLLGALNVKAVTVIFSALMLVAGVKLLFF